MIVSVEEFRKQVSTAIDDDVIKEKLLSIEMLVRKYTNNNFQNRKIRSICDCVSDKNLTGISSLFKAGDTVQISDCINEGLYVIKSIEGSTAVLYEAVLDERNVIVTKVQYPADVKMGVINMLKWDIEKRNKVGIQSETISRHAVTYFNMDGDNSAIGYPKSLVGFLKPYMRARF